MRTLPPAATYWDDREIDAVVDVLRGDDLELGPRVAEFEGKVAALLGKRHGVMVNSGTSSLRLAIDLLDLEPGDEIVTSVLTFSADIAPMVQSGLVPAFVDVDVDSYQIDVDRIEEMIGPRTRAILTPNLVGNVPDWDRIREIADRHGLKVVEDSCDIVDCTLRGERIGTRSDISVTSFARSHSITAAGNGGLVALDDDELLDRCLVMRRWGRRSESYLFGSRKGSKARFQSEIDGISYDDVFVFEDLGYNFEPSEIMAAFGLVQLERLAEFNRRRQHNWQRYDDWFANHEDRFIRPRTTEGADTAWMLYPFIIQPDAGLTRTGVQEFLEERGIPTRVVWSGNITRQPGYRDIERREPSDGFPNADRIMEYALMLPTHQRLTSDDVGYVIEQLTALVDTV